ncbi:CarboxypepD_reg-like domain-containing protein [Paenimyroides ummariense]|uniref:CarboxypepD_reg-like domain-containing protein n=1 Tax=Paenimyroides ummariense TaxID=913024 RepID=A0A1I4WBG1_9FLAO|nr:carboxypeptidase-like regulatory domain-containing protein [Paenimyroides ummariense]SFN11058.1 CarboxypepD_reg-like domain-containing protein [Paenimyroides ummariense]
MAKNNVNNHIKINRLFVLCRYVAVVFGIVLLSTWTVKSASLVNSTKQVLQQDLFKEITGVVKSEQGDPIPGVVVKLAGTNVETVTDAEGRYKFNVKKGDRIQFIYRGYKTSIATVRKSNILNVKMIKDDADLPDVIISFNYHSATGCTIDTVGVKKTELNKNHFVDIAFPLVFNVDMRPSEVYREPETILKDVENLTRNGNYTYIIDGVRVSEETFRSLNQNDVESVDIYKHTDVYNARFGNKENQSRISLNAR